MTSGPTVGPGERFRNAMEIEFAEWEETVARPAPAPHAFVGARAHPDPTDTGGLPTGWESTFVWEGFRADTDLHLVHRLSGGVGIVRHESDLHRTMLIQTADDLLTLDRWLHDAPGATGVWSELLQPWVRECLTSLYDPSDPAEAAEQTLLVLSGRVRVPPRSAF